MLVDVSKKVAPLLWKSILSIQCLLCEGIAESVKYRLVDLMLSMIHEVGTFLISHFLGEEAEAQVAYVTCPRSCFLQEQSRTGAQDPGPGS